MTEVKRKSAEANMDSMGTDFEWLADLHKSQCFTTCEVSNPAKSSDFGADGFTASLTDWHELLQLTAPDKICGVVFVRGQFPNTPDAILARAQRRDDTGFKGTFGTRLEPAEIDTDLELGERRAQGWVNFRWPYTQYTLKRKDDKVDGNSGTYEEISFVRSGTVFQIIRIKWGSGSSISDFDSTETQDNCTVKVKAGGIVRFGCPCSNDTFVGKDAFKLAVVDNGNRVSCVSETYQKRLQVQMSIRGTPQDTRDPLESRYTDGRLNTEADVSSIRRIELSIGDPIYIVSSYALRDADDERDAVNDASFADLEDYLGVSNASLNMTDRLWTALCSTNYEASEAVEFCVVGRCVEQILGVTSIPFPSPGLGVSSALRHSPAETVSLEPQEVFETALINNLITPQHVDVQSTFFQIRLLVKVFNFISTRHFEPDLLENFRSLDEIRVSYLNKIKLFIRSSLTWLVNTDLKPWGPLLALKSDATPNLESLPPARRPACQLNRMEIAIDQSYNKACYATLAVWYVMQRCQHAITHEFKTKILLPKLGKAYESVQKRASRNKEPTPKNDVLQWLHLSCLFLICNEYFTTDPKGEARDGFASSGIDRQELLNAQQRFEKYVSRLKTSQIESYSIEHEELDRVILLGEELGLDAVPTPFTYSLASSRAQQSRRRIIERKRTTRFNPGPKQGKISRMISNGPWELLCTNHQSFLRVTDDSNIRAARDRLFEFLMSDYSFMTSWDRADSDMIGKWWDAEPVSVICATLLDLKVDGKLRSAMSEEAVEGMNQSMHNLDTSPIAQRATEASVTGLSQEQSLRDILLQLKQSQEDSHRDHLLQFKELLVREEIGSDFSTKAFDWMTCKPAQEFHPIWWVQSLQDTPEVYQNRQIRYVALRKDTRRYLKSRKRLDITENPEYTSLTIKDKLPAEELRFLSVFDIFLTSYFTFETMCTSIETLPDASLPANSENRERSLSNNPRGSQKAIFDKQVLNFKRSGQLESYREALFEKLNDSLVDLGVKHRILFAEKCSPSVVGAFIYMWHPDALDTIDNYFGASSRFAENREAMMWTTTITVSHWSIRPRTLSKANLERFEENRSNGDFPPESIARLKSKSEWSKKGEKWRGPAIVEERSSSLVITGDPSGYLWICSIWSSLTDSESVAHPIHTLTKILQRFVHQQSCARCLVFLILLGHLCEKLTVEYELILTRLDVIVGLGEQVLLEGLEWGTSEAVDKLKKMLWGLEALRVFDDRLSASLAQIQKAQDAMERTVKQEAGQQHVDLLQEYNNVIEEFEKRYGMLSDVHLRTQLKIKQVTGLRDGISTVTNVEDSQTALRDSKTTIRQGNNIRILTYITIAYLPLGFVTGLFSISHATFMDNVGNIVFAILVVVFVLGTYALALSLESLLDQWKLAKQKLRARNSIPNITSHEEAESTGSFGVLGNCCGLRRRAVEDELEEKV